MSHTQFPFQLYLAKTTVIFDHFVKLYCLVSSTYKADLRFGITGKEKCETFEMWVCLKKRQTFSELNLFSSGEEEGITPLEIAFVVIHNW